MQESAPLYLKNILSTPRQEDLLELYDSCRSRLDMPCCLTWLAPGPINPRLVLTAIAYHDQRSGWHGQEIVSNDPEWQLDLQEEGSVRKKIWGALKTSDLALVLSLIPDLDTFPEAPPPEPLSKIGLPFPDQAHEKFTGSLLKRSVLTRVQTAPATQKNARSSAGDRGMMLSGNVKEINVFDLLQSIHFCKMTGKLTAFDVDRFLELYACEGEITHARAAHALLRNGGQLEGENALLDLFCWEEGTFKFQPGLTTADRSVSRNLQGLLMEGAMLKDYRSYLKKQNLTRQSRLAIAPATVQLSEAKFDEALKDGIDVHLDLQKKIFIDLREPQKLERIIVKYDLSNLVWIQVIFNLLKLDLIAIESN